MGVERNYSCFGENDLGGWWRFFLTGAELWKIYTAADSKSNGNSRTVGAAHSCWAVCHEHF